MMFVNCEATNSGGLSGLELRAFSAGEIIFDDGDCGDVAYIIEAGEVELAKVSLRGLSVIGYAAKGDLFGEMALIDGSARMARARAVTDVKCLVLDKTLIEAELKGVSPLGRAIINVETGVQF
jgi:CRP-like cAMP-binding protein